MRALHKKILVLALSATPTFVFATNGMNLEGYGATARGMGGASMAYDNGLAGMMNNPATLGFMQAGAQALDLGLGFLGPNVKSSIGGMSSKSSADKFWIMPAGIGYATKSGIYTYGIGMFAQGGMGTEYDSVPLGLGAGTTRSEVGVGRLIFPLTVDVDPQLKIGGSLDVIWATMDLQMAMTGQVLGSMMQRGAGANIAAPGEATGSLAQSMGAMGINPNWARFDFSNNNDFIGDAKGAGWTGKLGLAYQINKEFSVGATYHLKSYMSDLSTSNAKLSMDVGGNVQTLTGDLKLKNFQWPETYGIGLAYRPMDRLLLAADIKRIKWSKVMDSFNMSFTASNAASNGGFAGKSLDAKLYQNWDDQTVYSLGGSYRVNNNWTLRAGVNLANNPIPSSTLNFLFPAITKSHYSVGAGYDFNKNQSINGAFIYAPTVEQTSASGVTTSHSQTNWEIMYSHRF
jgi:long-chain fatty acid transport protein